jgi:hypothetical protein
MFVGLQPYGEDQYQVFTLSKYGLSKAAMYLDVDTIEWMLGMLFNAIT